MGISSIKVFRPNKWVKLLKYSLENRLKNSLPKGLKITYDLISQLERRKISFKNDKGLIRFEYPIANKTFYILIDQDSSDASVFNQIILKEEYRSIFEKLKSKNIILETMIDAGFELSHSGELTIGINSAICNQ